MIIELRKVGQTKYELTKFYRESGDPPGSGKRALCSILSRLSGDTTIILDASGGQDEVNTRSKWFRWFTKDKRTFGTWTIKQLNIWMFEHKVPLGFREFVNTHKIQEARTWVRILASNEKLVKYYKKLGFASLKNELLPTVHMKATVKKILAHCK